MAKTQDLKQRLARILYDKSYLEGEFTLTSGRRSDYYFDCRQSSLNPEGAVLIGTLFFQYAQALKAEVVAGMTMGADPLVTATSVIAYQQGMHLPALIVRKEPKGHGAGRAIEGLANVTPGQRILMLEDVISTGGSVLKACKLIENAGLQVMGILCILNREEGAVEHLTQAGYTTHALFTRKELLELAGTS